MLFSAKLKREAFEAWEEHYLDYDKLRRSLKETRGNQSQNQWTEEDESQFVQLLDRNLEKVYSFESHKYNELSDRISTIENQIKDADPENFDPKEVEPELESILENANTLDHFRRLNYTGFVKIVKRHDRIHPMYQVRPLLQVRLQALPFHSEDYSPLLYRLSKVHEDISAKFGTLSETRPSIEGNHARYVTLQYWVHPENLMEVKTRILRRLPILVYNREDNDLNSTNSDPVVTSLYLDNPEFSLYQSQLSKTKGLNTPTSVRFRWYGPLWEKPDIVLEQHNEENGKITRINLKQKQIEPFLHNDASVIEKRVTKMKSRQVASAQVADFQTAATELQEFISENAIQPMLRTIYKRAAFEIPGDDRVRVIIDSDIMFIREDSLNAEHPIRDPAKWHRTDLDQPNVDIRQFIRKGEYASFPYSVLEVRLKHDEISSVLPKPAWVEDLTKSNLIKEVPHFTKYLQGIASLYGEDDRLDSLPFWLDQLDSDNKLPQKLHPDVPSSSRPSVDVQRIMDQDNQWNNSDDDDDSEDGGDLLEPSSSAAELQQLEEIGFPTRITDSTGIFEENEEADEVILPPGVTKPQFWLKNQSSINVETKVWLANERTFNKWLNTTAMLSALTFTLYSSVRKTTHPHIATVVAYILFSLTIFTGCWGYWQYVKRLDRIKAREDAHLDDSFGPLLLAAGLLLALVINFAANFESSRNLIQYYIPIFDAEILAN